jgi:hypothetical protein
VNEPLAPGDSIMLEGFIVAPMPFEGLGGEVRVWIHADSCYGEEFVDAIPCQVEETNEDNNVSPAIVIVYPTPPPTDTPPPPTDIPTPVETPPTDTPTPTDTPEPLFID